MIAPGRISIAFLANSFALACFLASTTFAGAQGANCPQLTPAQYQRFIDITLQDEDGNDERNFVIRWESDIRMEVLGSPTAEDRSNLEAVIADLAVLAPSVSVTEVKDDANFWVYYVPIESYGELIQSWGAPVTNLATACATFYYWRRGGEIVEARVLLPTNAVVQGCGTEAGADYGMSLTREEITQALGFPNDVHGERESIFDQNWSPRDYSPTDRLIISALYCADVRAGMTEPALWPLLVAEARSMIDLLRRSVEGQIGTDDIIRLQSFLVDLGYKIGLVDGILDQSTLDAVVEVRERLVAK